MRTPTFFDAVRTTGVAEPLAEVPRATRKAA